MRTKSIIIALVMISFCVGTCADAEMIVTNITQSEGEDILNNPSNTVVGLVGFRAGGISGRDCRELFASDGNKYTTVDMPDSFVMGASYSYSVTYDASGNLTLEIPAYSGELCTITTTPDDWFNTIVISLKQNRGMPFISGLTLDGSVDSEVFQTLTTSSMGDWDGVAVVFPENMENSQESFIVTGTFVVEGLTAGRDDFRCEFNLVQQPNLPQDTEQELPDPPVVESFSMNDGLLEIIWTAETNFVWYLQKRDSMSSGDWTDVGEPLSTSNGTINVSMSPEKASEFFRLVYKKP